MIRHIVMFKLKEFQTDALKQVAALEVKKRLDELPSKIDLIRQYSSGIDIRNLSWSYNIVLTMDFDSMADLDSYTIHPAHQDFVTFNKEYSVSKVCADYEI
jgi:hypothetical protein